MISEEDLDLMTPEELERAEEAARKKAKSEGLAALSSKIMGVLRNRIGNRSSKHEEWIECSNLYYGSMYSMYNEASNPFQNRDQKKKRPDFNVVRLKCDAALSQCIDMQFGIGEKNWDLWPAANSVDPMDTVRCQLMSDEIETQLDKCRYGFQSRKAMFDRVVLGTGILKGPVNTGRVENTYKQDPMTGEWVTTASVVYKPTVVRVDPWMFFPDDTTNDPCKIRDAIELHPMTANELAEFKLHEGYIKSTIDEVLKTPPSAYNSEYFLEYVRLSESNPQLFKDKYCVVEWHGPISKNDLDAIGQVPYYESATDDYYAEVWLCNGKVIRIDLENIEGTYETPYSVSAWRKDPSSVFGFGHPLSMRDQQRVVTQTWHMILDNSSLSSGPQAAIQKRFIQPADGQWTMAPRKVWHLTDPMMKVGDAIQFFETPNVTQDLLPVLQLAREFSEEESGNNAISAALSPTRGAESATGSLMQDKNSTTILDQLSEEWDDAVTEKVIRRMYAWNMQYSENQMIKGNYSLDVRSANEYKNKQLHVRDIEKLSVESAQNPHLAKWINQDELTHLRLSMMHLPTRNIIRTQEEAAAWEQQQAQQAAQNDPNAIKAQVEMAKLEVEKQRLELDAKLASMQANMDQQRYAMDLQIAQMKEQVALANNQAMALAGQAAIAKAQLDYEAKMAKIQLDAQQAGIDTQLDATKFDAEQTAALAMEQQNIVIKHRELDLYEEEMKLKREKGEGI